MHLVVINAWHLNVRIIDQQESSFGIILEVQRLATLGSWLELYNTLLHMDLKNTITIRAVIGHLEFASQAVERKDVGNSARVEIHRRVAEIGLCCGGELLSWRAPNVLKAHKPLFYNACNIYFY